MTGSILDVQMFSMLAHASHECLGQVRVYGVYRPATIVAMVGEDLISFVRTVLWKTKMYLILWVGIMFSLWLSENWYISGQR
jgi:hypothetical protein